MEETEPLPQASVGRVGGVGYPAAPAAITQDHGRGCFNGRRYCLAVLEAEVQDQGAAPRPLSMACRRPSSPLRVCTPSLCACLCPNLLCMKDSQIDIGPTLGTSL